MILTECKNFSYFYTRFLQLTKADIKMVGSRKNAFNARQSIRNFFLSLQNRFQEIKVNLFRV